MRKSSDKHDEIEKKDEYDLFYDRIISAVGALAEDIKSTVADSKTLRNKYIEQLSNLSTEELLRAQKEMSKIMKKECKIVDKLTDILDIF